MGTLAAVFFIILGGAALVCGGEALVRGATKIALNLKIPSLIIGLTVVAVGTSAPEMATSFSAAIRSTGIGSADVADVALGNVIGSNICNILLILGCCALIRPLNASRQIVRRECPAVVLISLTVFLLAAFNVTADGGRMLPRWSGGVLILLFVAYDFWIIREARRAENAGHVEKIIDVALRKDEKNAISTDLTNAKNSTDLTVSNVADSSVPVDSNDAQRDDFEISPNAVAAPVSQNWGIAIFSTFFGLILLIFGAHYFVGGAISIARTCGVSEMVIGLTLVAVGTSLPELTVSAIATFRGEIDVAIGNVLGSNICNVLCVLGGTLLLLPSGMTLKPQTFYVDLPVMCATAALAAWFCFTDRKVRRWEGAVLVLGQIAYAIYLVRFAG